MKTDYKKQAIDFLVANKINIRITLSNTKPANWEPAGNHYRITLFKATKRIVFDFWGSVADMAKCVNPDAYDVLACISGDVYCPDNFKDFCDEYGYEEDSIKALQTFRRANRFATRLREFFTEEEIEQLSKIQ